MKTSTRELVDPELIETLDAFGAIGFHSRPVSSASLDDYRETMEQLVQESPEPDTHGVSVSEASIPATDGSPGTRALVCRPLEPRGRLSAIMYIHGGGFVFGSPEGSLDRCVRMARELGVLVVVPAYKLAPENPFPAGLNDCLACLRFMHQSAAALEIDHSRIAVSGDSAGGGLAASVAQLSRSDDELRVVFQALIYPMLDDQTGRSKSVDGVVGEFVWTPESNVYAWDAYLQSTEASRRDEGVPSRCTDLRGLPPTWIGTASLDLFLDENIAYARSLIDSGVLTELAVYPGTFHAFIVDQTAAISRRFEREYFDALRRGLGLPSNDQI